MEDFIEDEFNLTGLNSHVSFYKEAMEMVLDVEPEDTRQIPDVSIVEASAEVFYGLVHQRFILTRAGLHAMAEKYESGQFGTCPRVYCLACHVVPCGRSDTLVMTRSSCIVPTATTSSHLLAANSKA